MVKVTVGNNLKQKDVVVPQDTTLYDVLTQNGISTNTGFIQLNGQTIDLDELDSTFEDFGITDSCLLVSVAKASNG